MTSDILKYAALPLILSACLSWLAWCGVLVKRSHDSTTQFIREGILEDAGLIIWSDSATQAGRVERAAARIKRIQQADSLKRANKRKRVKHDSAHSREG